MATKTMSDTTQRKVVHIGELLRKQREKNFLSAYRVAVDTGINVPTIRNIEKGANFRISFLFDLMDYYGLDLDIFKAE